MNIFLPNKAYQLESCASTEVHEVEHKIQSQLSKKIRKTQNYIAKYANAY